MTSENSCEKCKEFKKYNEHEECDCLLCRHLLELHSEIDKLKDNIDSLERFGNRKSIELDDAKKELAKRDETIEKIIHIMKSRKVLWADKLLAISKILQCSEKYLIRREINDIIKLM